ncbi:hypothetical protein FRC01_006497 [Tulasnella sp. 417]|nr:hypothetical protein FRC01_006497 [Tulasnella sp. 417]
MADPTNAPPDLQVPSKTDLLIRSLTTALALFSPDSGAKNRHHQSGRYDQFDRMSLFFVSNASEDVAAITALVEDNYINFQAVQSRSDAGRLKNPDHRNTITPNEDSEASVKYLQDPVRWVPKASLLRLTALSSNIF